MKTTAAQTTTPTSHREESSLGKSSASARNNFIMLALNMSWQLLVVVLLPVIGGVALDKKFDSGTLWTIVGLLVALLGSIAVIAQAARTAGTFPVPKLSDADRKVVQKRIADDDREDDA